VVLSADTWANQARVARPANPATRPPAAASGRGLNSARSVSAAGRRHGLGLITALATLSLLVWGLGRPALWLDESASVAAAQRSWSHLWILLQGPDAPLVPYYLLLKAATTAATNFFPHAAAHPEVLYRWPSVAAMTIAVWVLAVWLARFSTTLVLSVGAVLLATGGISRYGQEARPYAFVMLFAVLSTVVWARIVQNRRWRWLPLYSLSVALMVAANSLAATLIAAHLIACLVATERGKRWSAALRTICGGVAGLLLVAPEVLNATAHGKGATLYPTLTAQHLLRAFLKLVTLDAHPFLGITVILCLSLLGLSQVALSKYRFVARLAACWAIVPLLLLVAAISQKPNLLIGRYALFTIPAWAILAGLGIITIGQFFRELVTATIQLALGTTRIGNGRHFAAMIGAASAAGMVVVVLITQLGSLQQMRGPGGHDEDIRPAIALADSPGYASLPIVVTSRLGAIGFVTYVPQDEYRLVGLNRQDTSPIIWLTADPTAAIRQQLVDRSSPIIVLVRASSARPGCNVNPNPTAIYVQTCMNPVLQRLRYRAVNVKPAGRGWTFAVLTPLPQRPRAYWSLPRKHPLP